MDAPIELPTQRQSRHFDQLVNIHDPTWIPVLNKSSTQSHGSTPYFDATPRYPSRGSSRPATPRDGGAQNTEVSRAVPQELDAGPISKSQLRHGSSEPHNRQRSRETEDTLASSGDDTVLSADAPSTAGTGSLLENQVYSLPRPNLKESRSFTQASVMSDRASIVSTSKRPAIPTSRYNRKPGVTGSSLPGSPTPTSPVLSQYRADSPRSFTLDAVSSRKMSSPSLHDFNLQQTKPTSPISLYTSTLVHEPTRIHQATTSLQQPPLPPPTVQELSGESSHTRPIRSETAVELPTTALPQLPPEPPSYEASNNRNRRSTSSIRTTASVRKKRALHSHPSNPSLRSEKLESNADAATSQAVTQSVSSTTTLRRTRTNESRRSVVTDATPPTNAPSDPLPELPQKAPAKRPSTRHKIHKTSEGNLSLFPQQSSVSQTPAITSSPPKPELPQHKPPPVLYYSPSSFSVDNNTMDSSSEQHRASHRHNQSEASNIPHKELANFMTSKSTLIFRRFDEMHVKLLLSIQDEIAALERELIALENASQKKGSDGSDDEYDDDEDDYDRDTKSIYQEKDGITGRKSTKRDRPRSSRGVKGSTETRELRREKRKIQIMADLRRLLAEYDHLHSNWALMQKSPATVRDRRELERYLSGDVGSSATARADLLWAENNASDLSCVSIGDNSATNANSRPPSRSKASAWGKSMGKLATKGSALNQRSDSFVTNTSNGIAKAYAFDRSTSADAHNEKGRPSIFATWFANCAGKRK